MSNFIKYTELFSVFTSDLRYCPVKYIDCTADDKNKSFINIL